MRGVASSGAEPIAQVWTHTAGWARERTSGSPAGKVASQVWSLHRGLDVSVQTTEGVEGSTEGVQGGRAHQGQSPRGHQSGGDNSKT